MKLCIAYENSNLTFEGKNAEIVEKALFEAEKRGAEGTHFTIEAPKDSFSGNYEYWLSTKKYLFWYTEQEN